MILVTFLAVEGCCSIACLTRFVPFVTILTSSQRTDAGFCLRTLTSNCYRTHCIALCFEAVHCLPDKDIWIVAKIGWGKYISSGVVIGPVPGEAEISTSPFSTIVVGDSGTILTKFKIVLFWIYGEFSTAYSNVDIFVCSEPWVVAVTVRTKIVSIFSIAEPWRG